MIVFGSTGSIGVNTLKLAKAHNIKISALACGDNIALLNEQISEFKPEFVCIKDEAKKSLVHHKNIFVGQNGLKKILNESDDDFLVNAIVGFAGLKSSLEAAKLNKKIALANKESLVVAGKFLQNARINPIDSEHAALKFLLQNQKNIEKLIITASGGAFFNFDLNNFDKINAKMALKHPNWSMGAKITIDSASMANKLFELIEAKFLFDKFEDKFDIEALIEPSSSVHALLSFKDGGMSAYFSAPDMKLAISQAILEKFEKRVINSLNLTKLTLKFYEIDLERYPIFALKDELLKKPDLGVLINAANEVAVYKFLKDEIKFNDISTLIFKTLNYFGEPKISNIDEIFELDFKVREFLNA